MADAAGKRLIETREDGGVVVVQLNRPPANALTADFLDEIDDVPVRQLRREADVLRHDRAGAFLEQRMFGLVGEAYPDPALDK